MLENTSDIHRATELSTWDLAIENKNKKIEGSVQHREDRAHKQDHVSFE